VAALDKAYSAFVGIVFVAVQRVGKLGYCMVHFLLVEL
jgi:hypothetical protein